MAIELKNLVCVVTGADDGVGNGLVHGFVKRGARVVAGLLDVRHAPAVAPATAVQMDVTKADEVRSAVDAIIAQHGRIDVWINNAGIYPRVPADQVTYELWRKVVDTNLEGAWRCCEAIIPHLKRQRSGVIINVGSIALRMGMADVVPYLASKGGLVGITRGLARDLGRYGVRANCVHLGGVLVPSELRVFPDTDATLRRVEEKQSLPGRMTPESVEPLFAFLASDDSRDVTGQCITADRGWTHD